MNTPDISWREIISLRNFLVHEYFGVDEIIIWQIITVDIPQLKEKLKAIWLILYTIYQIPRNQRFHILHTS